MRLSVVIPVYNQASEIVATLDALAAAISASAFEAEVIVVDDGSTDGTAVAVETGSWPMDVRVLRGTNQGRFLARRLGLENASADWCLLLDSRVIVDPGSLLFLERQLQAHPERRIWNAHVDVVTDGNPYGVFWDVVTRRVFSAYFSHPRTTSFGTSDFERFPKGTTCFFGPRGELVAAFGAFRSRYADPRHGNDDTPIIRGLAAREPINISPGFRCAYAPRSALGPFVRHAFHRGTVFFDGHARRESRWFVPAAAFFPASLAWMIVARRGLVYAAAPFALAAVGGAALALAERRPRAAVPLALVTPIYAAGHAIGMWRGLVLAARDRARRS